MGRLGIEYEADPRQVEKLLVEIELADANGVVTPGIKVLAHQVLSEAPLPRRSIRSSARLPRARTTSLLTALT